MEEDGDGMSAIWQRDENAWRLLAPSGFPDEATLHGLVEQAPHMLPLAGGPQLTVVGREVLLGGNWADLIAVESTGRLVIVEIKLAKSAEARRAVIAQILTYAAFLRGMDPDALEDPILGTHLTKRGYTGLAQAVATNDQTGSFDAVAFGAGLTDSLRDGRFRLVLVLDEAPPELVRLVAYLQAVADKLVIDLITVAAYDAGGTQLVVPQRVEGDRMSEAPVGPPKTPDTGQGLYVTGADAFVATIEKAPADQRPILHRLADWAVALEAEGLVKLGTYHGKSGRTTLLPRIPAVDSGLVTIWNDGGAYLSFWRSVFVGRAPKSLARLELLPDAPKIGQGTTTKAITEVLLTELTEAYREAAGA